MLAVMIVWRKGFGQGFDSVVLQCLWMQIFLMWTEAQKLTVFWISRYLTLELLTASLFFPCSSNFLMFWMTSFLVRSGVAMPRPRSTWSSGWMPGLFPGPRDWYLVPGHQKISPGSDTENPAAGCASLWFGENQIPKVRFFPLLQGSGKGALAKEELGHGLEACEMIYCDNNGNWEGSSDLPDVDRVLVSLGSKMNQFVLPCCVCPRAYSLGAPVAPFWSHQERRANPDLVHLRSLLPIGGMLGSSSLSPP